jgi:two-component system cell cycle sensor histidine kinase/response regulator CckA
VALEVADTGVGMGSRIQERIFDPFFTTKPAGEGTGLGLAMVYGVVKQSGGFIHVESKPGRGSRFVLRFPAVDAPPEPQSRPRQVAGEERSDPSGTSMDIVLVEDDPSVRRVTRRILERAGHRVRLFPDAETALEGLEEADPPDLLISDMGLPGLSGPALLERLRADYPDLRVVAISGYARGSLESGEVLPDEVAFLPKPFTPDELLIAVSRPERPDPG